MFGLLIEAVTAVNAVKGSLGYGGGLTADQQRRVAEGETALAQAQAGDLGAAQTILDRRFHSIAFSKQIAEKSWTILLQQNPQIAAQALQSYTARDPTNTPPSVQSQLRSEWDTLIKNIRNAVGTAVQRVGAGATTGAAQAIDPNTTRTTVPFVGGSTMWMLVLVALIVAAAFYLSKHKAK